MAEWTTSGPGEGGLCEAAVFVVLECEAVGSGGEGAGDGSCGVCLVSPGVQDEGAVDVEAVSVVAADGEGGLPRSGVTSDVWCWMAPLKGCSHAQAVSEGVPRGSGAGRSEP